MTATKFITRIILAAGFVIALHCGKLKDDLPAPTSSGVLVHPAGWRDSSSVNFHGRYLSATGYDLSTCAPCHANSFNGGTSGISCFACHGSYPHRAGWTDSNAAGFHGKFIGMSGWDMLQCRPCHGATYAGGRVASSCLTCHQKPNGPENCTTCHGGTNFAPPRDLTGNTSRTKPGVGAHQPHVEGGSLASPVGCTECHTVPSSVYQPGHIDGSGRARVNFNGPLGTTNTAGGTFVPHPQYLYDSLTCANMFCHGNWRLQKSISSYPYAYTDTVMTGSNHSPLWTGTSSEAACGTCHGLPPTGHFATTLCSRCHTGIIDINGNIIDSTKHINGKVNVFGEEYNF